MKGKKRDLISENSEIESIDQTTLCPPRYSLLPNIVKLRRSFHNSLFAMSGALHQAAEALHISKDREEAAAKGPTGE
jgi:hypothetical protein